MNDRDTVIFAALLHDIGKFAQRADVRLSGKDRGIESSCCHPSKKRKGYYTHQHVLYSGKWIREFLGDAFGKVENLALFHHRPETWSWPHLAKIVTLADRLSSGERESRPEKEESGRVPETLLTCLFTKLGKAGGEVQDFPMLALDPNLAPWWSPGPHQPQYPKLWDNFNREVKTLNPTAPPDLLFHQLLALLEKYTLFMPSAAYRDRPDIPLFHHLKATAALAACLYDLAKEERALDDLLAQLKPGRSVTPALEEQDFLLVAADISGIQDFIYSITSEKALKGLKGRSLYLELLARAVAEQVLRELQLTSANLLFLGGGHFYLLAPRTETVENTVKKWQDLTNQVLVQAHGGRLALVLHQEPVAYRHFLRDTGDFAMIWKKAATGLAREKRRKFASCWQDEETAADILGPLEALKEERACKTCGEELSSQEDKTLCPACESFTELARDSATALYLKTTLGYPRSLPTKIFSYREVLESLGVRFEFKGDCAKQDLPYTLRLNAADLSTPQGPCRGFAFLAHHVPRQPDGEVKTLEDMSRDAQGIKKWGLLRADVDNLGQVFTEGLGEEDRTLSRVSTLSQLLTLFFSGHVQHVISTVYRDSVYLVYAGGDDLCLLGPWSVLPDLARRLREDFGAWTRGRLTLSAGLYLAPRDKFPVYQAADAAGDLLDTAKRHRAEKDSLGIFDQAVRWEYISTLADVKDLLAELLDRHGVPRALLSLLKASWQEKEQHDQGALPMYRVWNLLYGMRRLTERLSRDQQNQAIVVLQQLEQKLIVNHNLRAHTDIAIRWAEYLTRKEEKQ